MLDASRSLKPRQVGVANNRISAAMSASDSEQDDRYKQIAKVFAEIDANADKELSFQEIHSFLNHRIGATFDEELLRELFHNLDKDHNSVVTSEEFVHSYVEAEKLVAEHIAIIERQLEENRTQLNKTLAEKRSADLNEKMNQIGLMEGSMLTVHVIEAQNLKAMDLSGTADAYVELTCEGQKIETKVIKDSLNSFWDEKFTFAITQGNDDLKITVWSKNKAKKEFEGQLAIPLNLLRDQMKHEEWFELQPQKKGERWQGRVHISLQWIWSRRVYFDEMAKQWQAVIDEDIEQMRSLKSNLNKLRGPFGEPQAKGEISQAETAFSRKLDYVAKEAFGKEVDWSYAATVVTWLMIAVSALSCFARSDFLTNIIAATAFYYLSSKRANDAGLRMLAVAAFFAVISDVTWIVIEGVDYLRGGMGDNSVTLMRLSVLFTVIGIVVKVSAAIVWFKEGQEEKRRAH